MITLSRRQIRQAILLALVILMLFIMSITAFQSMPTVADQAPVAVAIGPIIEPNGQD